MKKLGTRILFLVLAFAVVAGGMALPLPEGLPEAARASLVDLLFLIILWIGNVFPKPVSSLLAMMMLFWLGAVDTFSDAIGMFVNDVFFFLLAAFSIAASVSKSPLPYRIINWFVEHSHNSAKRLLLAFMIMTALISTIISDLAACALFSSIAVPMLKRLPEDEDDAKNFARCVMMGIPMAALAGGIMTPIGSPSNITLLSLLRESTAVEISFLGWMIVGVPIAFLSLFLSWAFLCLIYKPALHDDIAKEFRMDNDKTVAMTIEEKKLAGFLVGIFALWAIQGVTGIMSSTQVALLGMIVLFMPCMDLMDWETYASSVPWDLVIMLGGVMAAGGALISSGAITWVVNVLLVGNTSWSPIAFLAGVSIFIIIERAFVPMAPPVTIALSPIFMAIALNIGLHPLCIALAVSTWCQVTFLFPVFDACWLITFSEHYYKVIDVAKFGWLLTIILLAATLVMLPALSTVASLLP